MVNQVQSVPIERLVAHPDNANRMSKVTFAKLVRNIERTGLYEPLIVRPKADCYEIVNGHQRLMALQKLGFKNVDVVVWDVDDEQADILLATLNRLGGSDVLEKKQALLGRLNDKMKATDLAKLLPLSAKQIERLRTRAGCALNTSRKIGGAGPNLQCVAFFLDDEQMEIVEKAMSLASGSEKTKAARNAAGLMSIAESFVNGKGGRER